MSEARHFLLVGQHSPDVFQSLFLGSSGQQHFDHVFVSAAVQRTLQRSNRRSYGGVDVRQSRGRNASREGGSVQLMIGVQDQRDIEHMLHHVVRLLTCQRVEEIGGKSK